MRQEEPKLLGLVRYDAMKKAIAACLRVDEVMEIRSKARALEVYAAQSLDHEAEDRAREIRQRAEQRCGELLIETAQNGQRADRGHNSKKLESPETTPTLAELGIHSKDHSSRCQKLARVPKDLFEKLVKEPGITTEEIIRRADPTPPEEPPSYDTKVISLSIAMDELTEKKFERKTRALVEFEPEVIVAKMPDSVVRDTLEQAPPIIKWLALLLKEAEDERAHRIRKSVPHH